MNSKFSIGGAFGIYGPKYYPFAFVASGSEDGAIWLWDVSSKTVLQRLGGAHDGVVFGIDTHTSERCIVSGGADRFVKVWRCIEETEEAEPEKKRLNGDIDIEMEDANTG